MESVFMKCSYLTALNVVSTMKGTICLLLCSFWGRSWNCRRNSLEIPYSYYGLHHHNDWIDSPVWNRPWPSFDMHVNKTVAPTSSSLSETFFPGKKWNIYTDLYNMHNSKKEASSRWNSMRKKSRSPHNIYISGTCSPFFVVKLCRQIFSCKCIPNINQGGLGLKWDIRFAKKWIKLFLPLASTF